MGPTSTAPVETVGHTPRPACPSAPSYVITAAASTADVEPGQQLPDLRALAAFLAAKLDNLASGISEPSEATRAAATPQDVVRAYDVIARQTIASLNFQQDHDFVLSDPRDWQTIERACNEARLPGGSLTAAPGTPGWCAPCEVSDDFAPPAVLDGVVDLPTVVATRGCVTYPMMPDLSALYSQIGFCYPAADYDLAVNPNPGVPPVQDPYWAKNKPCTPVPCSTGTQTCVLDPCGLCLQSSLLVERVHDALIEYFITQALVGWGHRLNCRDLNQMIDQSTPLSVPRGETGPGVTASVLEVMEFYATWLRYRHRLGRDTTIEAVLPEWARGVVHSDLAKRSGVDLLAVTPRQVEEWFALRKIRVQWVMDFDEAYCDSGASPP